MMHINELPGYEWAMQNGWMLASYASNGISADYAKGRITLTVRQDGEADLIAMFGLILLKIGPFSFPHPKFDTLYGQLKSALDKCHRE